MNKLSTGIHDFLTQRRKGNRRSLRAFASSRETVPLISRKSPLSWFTQSEHGQIALTCSNTLESPFNLETTPKKWVAYKGSRHSLRNSLPGEALEGRSDFATEIFHGPALGRYKGSKSGPTSGFNES